MGTCGTGAVFENWYLKHNIIEIQGINKKKKNVGCCVGKKREHGKEGGLGPNQKGWAVGGERGGWGDHTSLIGDWEKDWGEKNSCRNSKFERKQPQKDGPKVVKKG